MKKSFPLPSYVKSALRQLNDAGYEAYIVGGAVRNWLLGIAVHDYDITTSAYPEETKQVFQNEKTIDTGIKHGTVTVILNKHPLEITTYRTEGSYEDHRHPDAVHFTRSLKEDCSRRDFTMNALCYHPSEGIIDYFGGEMDLQNFLIRAIGDPEKRFEEDALRILRAVRFAAQLGFEIEPNTLQAVNDKQREIMYVSKERIMQEFEQILRAPYFHTVLHEFRSIFELLIPELHEYSDQQWEAVNSAASRSKSDSRIRMAVLLTPLHDYERSAYALRRLKFPNAFIADVVDLLRYRSMPCVTKIDLKWILSRIHVSFSDYLDYRCAIEPELDHHKLDKIYHQIIENKECYSLKQLDINGKDMKSLGFRGERISLSMNEALRNVIEEKIPNEKEAILSFLKKMAGYTESD